MDEMLSGRVSMIAHIQSYRIVYGVTGEIRGDWWRIQNWISFDMT